jgi:WD40 repeat protein
MAMSRSRRILLVLIAIVAPDFAFGQTAPTDLAGDPLPPGAVARIGTSRYRIRGWHQQVFFTPDAATVIAKAEQSFLRFFDAMTGKVTGEIKDTDFYYGWSADLSPDGKRLALFGNVRSDKPPSKPTVRMYDVETRKVLWTSPLADLDRVDAFKIRFTPDGKRLITAGGDLRVWDAKTGDELFRQKANIGYGAMDLSRDGKMVAVGYYELYLWDWESGAPPRKLDAGLRTSLDGLKLTPDGKTLYVFGSAGGPRAFDVATGKRIERLEVGGRPAWLAYSPDATKLAVGYRDTINRSERERSIVILDVATGRDLAMFTTGPAHVNEGVWSRDGSRFAAVTDNRIWVWDLKSNKLLGPDVPGHEAMISTLAFSPDGRLFTASDDHTVRAWDPATGKQLLKLQMDGWVRGMDLSRDGSLVAGSALRNDFRVWDARSGKELFKLHGHGQMGGLRKVRFSADDQTLLSYGDDFYLRAWNTLTGKLKSEHRFRPPNPFGRGDDDDDDDRMMMFDSGRVSELGPDGNTFVRVVGKNVHVIAADTGKERFQFEADPKSVSMAALSPDGKRLLTAGPGVVPPKPKPGQMPEQPKDYQVTVWDLADAKAITKFRVPGSSFAGLLMFTPDGRTIVTNSSDAILRFWDAQTAAATGTAELPDRVGRVAFDGAGKRLAVSFWDGTAIVYDLAAVVKPPKKE